MKIDFPEQAIMNLSNDPSDIWTIDDATKGVCIVGGTGSGKTSASGKTIAKLFLKQGWGGIVLCAKADEVDLWKEYCHDADRDDDLIVFKKGAVHKSGKYKGQEIIFNPIDYEMRRTGDGAGETQNITNIFMNIYRMGNRIAGEGDTKEERYWDTALKRCLNRIIELIKLAGEDLSYKNMVMVLSSANNLNKDTFVKAIVSKERGEEIPDIDNNSNFCLKCLVNAYSMLDKEGWSSAEKTAAFDMVDDYFTVAFPSMADKTRSIVSESFMGLAEPFLSGILAKHFSGKTNIFPEMTYQNNKIIVLDFPIKDFLDAGITAQCVFKLLFQQSVERRKVDEYPIPVFLWADEAHYFINPYDQIFLTTARSSRTSTVYLSQNISNYLAVIGSGSDAKARVDSLLGNLCTKIFHANSDAVTNEYASRLIGDTMQFLSSAGMSQTAFSLQNNFSQGMNSSYLPQIQPREFTTLKTGGIYNNFEVNAIWTVSGKEWANGKNYLKVCFHQSFKKSI